MPRYEGVEHPINACTPATLVKVLAAEHADSDYQQQAGELHRLVERMQLQRGEVTRHLEDFDAMVLTVKYLAYLFDQVLLWRRAAQQVGDIENLRTILEDIAQRNRTMLQAVIANDARGRDATAMLQRTRPAKETSVDHLLYFLNQATTFAAELAAEPHAFAALFDEIPARQRTPTLS